MQAKVHPARITVDGYTRFCLTAITVLLTVLIVGLWADSPGPAPAAAAAKPPAERQLKGIPDSGAQRMAMVRELQATNSKLDKLIGLLQSGKLQVVVANLEASNEPPKTPTTLGK